MSTVKETVSPRAVKNVEKERKEHSREGRSLRQLRNAAPANYKPEKCENCGCVRKTPCTCLRKVRS